MTKAGKEHGMDELLDEVFGEFNGDPIPEGFTDRMLREVESRMAWTEIFTSFGIKVSLVLGSFIVLAGILFLTAGDMQLSYFSKLMQIGGVTISLIAGICFIFLFDQLILPFLFRFRNSSK